MGTVTALIPRVLDPLTAAKPEGKTTSQYPENADPSATETIEKALSEWVIPLLARRFLEMRATAENQGNSHVPTTKPVLRKDAEISPRTKL